MNSFSWQYDIWFVLKKTRFMNWKLGIRKLVLHISLKARRIDMSKWILASERNMFLYSTKSLVNNDKTFHTLVLFLKRRHNETFSNRYRRTDLENLFTKALAGMSQKTNLILRIQLCNSFNFHLAEF